MESVSELLCFDGRGTAMMIAIWIIAICEVIRALQNVMQIHMLKHDTGARDNAYAEFVKSLKQSDREYVRMMLEEFVKQEGKQP